MVLTIVTGTLVPQSMQDMTYTDGTRSIQSWALSAFVHSLALGITVAVLSDLPTPVQREPFIWNVALVEPPPAPSQPTPVLPPSPPSPTKPAPPTPAQVRPTESTPVVRTVQQIQQVHQMVRQEVSVPRPAMHEIVPIAQTSSQPIGEAQPVLRARELVHQAVSEARQLVQEAGPIPQEIQQTQQAIIRASPSATGVVTQEIARAGDAAPTAHDEPVHPVIRQPVMSSLASVQERGGHVLYTQSASQSAIETEPVTEVIEERRLVAATSVARAPVTELPVRAMPGTQADYGWLARELWTRVEQVKRYPRLARQHGWEGKVVVRAVIKADGSLVHEAVEESSGHEALDQDALDLMQQVCPLALKHPLGRPQVVVHVPIHYRIEQ